MTASAHIWRLRAIRGDYIRNLIFGILANTPARRVLGGWIAAARMGPGLVQAPRYHVQDDLDRGELIHVLPTYPPTPSRVCLLYPRNRQLSPRVRVFMDWLIGEFEARTDA